MAWVAQLTSIFVALLIPAPPKENDLISQITNMLVTYYDFRLPCDAGILIEPKTSISTFEFGSVEQAIKDGYDWTIHYLDSVQLHLNRSVSKEELS